MIIGGEKMKKKQWQESHQSQKPLGLPLRRINSTVIAPCLAFITKEFTLLLAPLFQYKKKIQRDAVVKALFLELVKLTNKLITCEF